MLSLLPTHHVSSYGTSTSHPTVQSSYDYSAVCNPTAWGSVAPYPSPPMSSSPSTTAHFASHADRAFDPAYARMRPQPQAHDMFWAQPAAGYPQAMYPHIHQQPQQHHHHHHQTTLPLHARSPRSIGLQQPYLPPLPVAEPYPNYYQSQQARDHVPQNGSYHMGMVPGQPSIALSSIASKAAQPKTVRRPKPHVQTACFNCKKAHLSCDIGRPCNRCKQSNKQVSGPIFPTSSLVGLSSVDSSKLIGLLLQCCSQKAWPASPTRHSRQQDRSQY